MRSVPKYRNKVDGKGLGNQNRIGHTAYRLPFQRSQSMRSRCRSAS